MLTVGNKYVNTTLLQFLGLHLKQVNEQEFKAYKDNKKILLELCHSLEVQKILIRVKTIQQQESKL